MTFRGGQGESNASLPVFGFHLETALQQFATTAAAHTASQEVVFLHN
jgi:hypothetical protein